MGSKPTCPPGWWCEPRPRKVGQGRAPPCRSHRTGIHGKGSRTCWQPCSRARRSQGECTRTRVRSPWCCQQWRWGSKAHPSIPAPTRGRCPCGSSPKNQGSQDCRQHLLQAEHHRHHLTQEARSTRDSSPMPPRLGCPRWSPRQSSWAVGALGINPICSKRIIKGSFSSPINHERRGIAPSLQGVESYNNIQRTKVQPPAHLKVKKIYLYISSFWNLQASDTVVCGRKVV